MSSHQSGPVTCPQCNAATTAAVRQIIAAHDLPVKAAFLQGRLNVVACPHCRTSFTPAIPTLYYDLEQGFTLVYAPAAPHPADDARATVNELTRALKRSLPPERHAPYLARPQRCASREAMVKAILAADGISEELLAIQTARAQLLDELLRAPSEAALKQFAQAHDAQLDRAFFELLTAHMQAAHMEGDQSRAQTLLAYRTFLGQHTSQGRQAIAAIDTSLGLTVIQSREDLLERLRRAADEGERADLVASGHALLDQSFFQLLDSAAAQAGQQGEIDAVGDLQRLRADLLELKARHTANERAAIERAAVLFAQVVGSPQPDQVLAQNRAALDESFFMVLGANIERARRQGQQEPARALELIGQLARAMREEQAA